MYYSMSIMKSPGLKVIITLCLNMLCNCTPHVKIKGQNTGSHRAINGEPVAVARLMQEYELDHMKLFTKEINKDLYLNWKDLENKDLDDYCRRYLQQCVPGRTTCEAVGRRNIKTLHYTSPGYEFLRNHIIVVTCEVQFGRKIMYYLTRALEPNCAYALSRAQGGHAIALILTIVYKHCDFELHDYNRNKKRKRGYNKQFLQMEPKEEFGQKCKKIGLHQNQKTGQIIADDESIKEYELEHQELQKKEAAEDFDKRWPYVTHHDNLHEYCHKYLNKCVPNRNTDDVVGSWSLQKLRWRSNEREITHVITVKCYIPDVSKRNYYFTKALDTNCVFALMRTGKHVMDPYQITFKHCNFNQPNYKQEDLGASDVPNLNMILNGDIKTEISPIYKTLELFSKN